MAKRLDRVFSCGQTRLQWQYASVSHLPFLASDHAPVYLQLCLDVVRDPSRRPFWFEAAWLKHSSFQDLLSASWNAILNTPAALEEMKVKLKKWNRDVIGDTKKKKENLMLEIKAVQDMLDVSQSDDLLRKEDESLKAFDVVSKPHRKL